MNKATAVLVAALLAILPVSAQATAQATNAAFDEWLKTGTANGWIVDGKIAQPAAPTPTPTPTAEPPKKTPSSKALVIVDSYFDSSKITGKVLDICIAKTGCELTPTPVSGTASAFHHGTAMAEIARKANPDVTLYLVRAASATKNPRTGEVAIGLINGNDFLAALNLVKSRKDEIAAVSFSYSINGNMSKPGECRLSTTGLVNVSVTDPAIRSAVVDLKAQGIHVFAATGNDRNRKPVSYPACIAEVESVASGSGTGFLPSSNYDSNTDYVGALPANVFSYTSSIYRLISHATSSATASVAAMWVAGLVTEKWVKVAR